MSKKELEKKYLALHIEAMDFILHLNSIHPEIAKDVCATILKYDSLTQELISEIDDPENALRRAAVNYAMRLVP